MTIQEAKELLYSYRRAEERYTAARAVLEEIETYAFRTGGGGGVRVKSSPETDRMAEVVSKLSSARKEALTRAAEAIEAMGEVIKAIDGVESPVLHSILERRYIRGQDFTKIAAEIGYSWRWTMKLHQRAIEEVARAKT